MTPVSKVDSRHKATSLLQKQADVKGADVSQIFL